MSILTRWAIGAAIGLGALMSAFFYGVGVGKAQVRSEALAALQRGLAAVQKVQGHIEQLQTRAAELEQQRQEKVREIYRDVPTVISKPIYRTVCVDADGVGLLDRAAAAANGGADRPGAAGDAGDAAAVPPQG